MPDSDGTFTSHLHCALRESSAHTKASLDKSVFKIISLSMIWHIQLDYSYIYSVFREAGLSIP